MAPPESSPLLGHRGASGGRDPQPARRSLESVRPFCISDADPGRAIDLVSASGGEPPSPRPARPAERHRSSLVVVQGAHHREKLNALGEARLVVIVRRAGYRLTDAGPAPPTTTSA